jgi:hypothetical protein
MRARSRLIVFVAVLFALPAFAAPDGPGCPVDLAGLRQPQVPRVASCASIHKDVCVAVCGARYDTLDIRNFGQTGSKPGLLCQDTSIEPMKNGKSYVTDPLRANCLEVHEGTFQWCTNYNRTVNGVNFGAFVQCQGRIIKGS